MVELDVNLDLATRDQYLQKIQEQIIAKRQMLLNKQKSLKQTMKQNDFLRVVHEDYSKYYDYIVKQKCKAAIGITQQPTLVEDTCMYINFGFKNQFNNV